MSQIVPGSDNNVAIDLITTHIRRQLESRTQAFREKKIWSQISEDVMPKLHYIPAEKAGDNDLKIHVLEQTPQLKVNIELRSSFLSHAENIGHLHHSQRQRNPP